MTKNPLLANPAAGSTVGITSDDARDHCWDLNVRSKDLGWTRWYFIRVGRSGWEMAVVEGADAEAVWRMLDDKPLSPPSWTEADANKYIGITRWRLRQGIRDDVWSRWCEPRREEKRRAHIARERRHLGNAPVENDLLDAGREEVAF